MNLVCTVLFCSGILLSWFFLAAAQVIELDDSFEEKRGSSAWLVEFYAPWCGHCRKLEPEYHRVSLELRNTEIRVGKVDATRFSSLAHIYGVRGYPTIKFIEGDNVFNHQGDRSQEGIVQFAKRAKGPRIKQVNNFGTFNAIKTEHANSVFFIYIGKDTDSELYGEFESIAQRFAVYSYFYKGESRILPETLKTERSPTVLCFKDGEVFELPEDAESLESWFISERYTAFPKVGAGGINEMSELNKRLLILVLNENSDDKAVQNRIKEIVHQFAKSQRQQYHKLYQFLWMSDPSTMEQVTMQSLETSTFIILDTVSHEFYRPSFNVDKEVFDARLLANFISSVQAGSVEAQGGSGILQRFKRFGFDVKSLVVGLWSESKWLALVVFGIPTLVVSLLCYGLCCIEPLDDESPDDENDEDDDEETSERKRQSRRLTEAKLQEQRIQQEDHSMTGDTNSHMKED